MRLFNDSVRYGLVAQALHWGIAALLVAQLVLAELAEDAPAGTGLLDLHRSIGITLLGLAALRLAWRFISPPPPPPPMARWQRLAAGGVHAAFYALLFALPLTGWMMSSAAGDGVAWFGWFALPDVVAPSQDLEEALEEIHETLPAILLALVAVHAAAAAKHQWLDRDGLLLRMLPGGRTLR